MIKLISKGTYYILMVFVLLKIDWFEQSFWLKNKDLIDEYIAKLKSGTNVSIKDIVSNNTWSDCFIVIIYHVPFNILNCLRLIRRKIGRPAAVWIVPYRSQSVILTLLFCVASNLTRTQLGAHQLCGYYRTLWPGKRGKVVSQLCVAAFMQSHATRSRPFL